MKKILLAFLFIVVAINSYSQDIIVNRFYNSGTSDGTEDFVELIVVKDQLDIRNWIIKDYANGTISLEDAGGKFRFQNIDLWKDLKSGTVIVLTKLTAANLLTYEAIEGNGNVISVGLNDTEYMTDLDPTKAFNLTLHEAVVIRRDDGSGAGTGQANAVHALGYGDFFNRITWGSISSPKSLFNIGVWSADSKVNGSVGEVALNLSDIPRLVESLDASLPLESLSSSWIKRSDLMSGWGYGAEVYNRTENFSGVKINAYCVIFNPKLIDLKVAYSTAPQKRLQQFILDEPGTVLAGLNGTFFSTSAALGFVKYGGQTHTQALATLSRNSKNYSVTRAAFGLSPDFKPSVAWVYPYQYTPYTNGGTPFTTPYEYEMPLAQDVSQDPIPAPTKESGKVWHVNTAIGGAPMLVKNSVVNLTADYELISVDNTSLRPRSAIGYTANGNVVLMAVEGGNSVDGVSGLTLLQLANLMTDVGCVGAVNLDGGGSTSLRVNNLPTVAPSDGVERIMPSVLLLKTKK